MELEHIHMEVLVADAANLTAEAVRFDVHFEDGAISENNGLRWTSDRTGLVTEFRFFDHEGRHTWSWFPPDPTPVVNGAHDFTMPARVNAAAVGT